MNNERLKLRILSLALILILSGTFTFCGDNTTEESTHFVYTADGISKGVQMISGTLLTEMQYGHKKQALTLTGSNSFAESVVITISNWDFQSPPENGILVKEYDATHDAEQGEDHGPHVECLELTGDNAGVSLCDGALVTFTMDGELYTSIFTGNENGTVTITEINSERPSVSGSFDVKVQSSIGEKIKLSGTFTNVKYQVF